MKYIQNESLSEHTTVKLGGVAKRFIIPESFHELLEVVKKEKPVFFIGGGSNLLISNRDFDLVVDLRSFDTSIQRISDGVFKVGASVRLQKLINCINEAGYGGIEYLYSVPGLVGGAVVMNAGRGKKYNRSISDYIISVDVIRDSSFQTISKDECKFKYRSSEFKGSNDIVVSVLFHFPAMSMEDSRKYKQERIRLCKEVQDNSLPNFGSVFMECNPTIMKLASKFKIRSGKIYFSQKTENWLLNQGGSYSDAIRVIRKIEKLHKIFNKKCKREVIVWE